MNYDKKNIVRNIELVLKKRDINKLSKKAYEFIIMDCGSIAHYSIRGWKDCYKDLRDFLNFFLVKNEYGESLRDRSKYSLYDKDNKREIMLEIVAVCEKYNENIQNDLNNTARQFDKEIGKRLVNGEITLKEIMR